MKAKKNLFMAPATKVVGIVFDFCQDVHSYLTDENGEFYPSGIEGMINTLKEFATYEMPTEIVKTIVLGGMEEEDCEELIVNYVINEYHKSLAA